MSILQEYLVLTARGPDNVRDTTVIITVWSRLLPTRNNTNENTQQHNSPELLSQETAAFDGCHMGIKFKRTFCHCHPGLYLICVYGGR